MHRKATWALWLLCERASCVTGFHWDAWVQQRGERRGNLVVGGVGNRTSALTTGGDEGQ